MTIKAIMAAAALATSTFSFAAQAANLVTNGDFAGTYTSNSEFGGRYGGQGVTGWTGNAGYNLFFTSAGAATTVNAAGEYSFSGNEKLWGVGGTSTTSPGTLPASPGGGSFVALDGDTTAGVQGEISQTISGLTAGQAYKLSFDWGAGQVQSRTGATTESFQVSLGSQSFTTSVVSNPSQSFTGWLSQSFTFTATSASELLSFLSIGTPNGLPPIATLDDVSLVQTPEPVSLALLGAGLLGLGAIRARRRG